MNLVASLQARLKNQARKQGIAYASLLEQFALSRFLTRLEKSDYAEGFILKGAQLFRFLDGEEHRPTRDADFLCFGEHAPDALQEIFSSICQLTPPDADALTWENIRAAAIREENSYGGVRVLVTSGLGKMRIPLQFDVGFGDVITPAIRYQNWASPLDYPQVRLATYPLETVIAEKLEAAVSLGINNSRMKDFFDLHWLAQHRTFDHNVLAQAIRATFERRSTALPSLCPLALTNTFANDKDKLAQWQAFVRKNDLNAPPLPEVIRKLHGYLWPHLQAAQTEGNDD
ncbi:MAG: hypothetical protein COA70_03755 [Planctomycetota bacterium]|nr:MAG: hypothetical protein COA70_03755 [Planctomycetota bacterium]